MPELFDWLRLKNEAKKPGKIIDSPAQKAKKQKVKKAFSTQSLTRNQNNFGTQS